jgi:pseudaminic acid synthase
MSTRLAIRGRAIGEGWPPYVVAELSANHCGQIERAFAVMDAAKAVGADAVKLQTYTPDTMTIDHDAPEFFITGGLWDGRKLYDLYKEAQTPWEWHEALFAKGRELGITVFSTPFDETAVELLERLAAPAYKIASFELVDLELIRAVAKTKKPVLMSTGMASPVEIAEAVEAFRSAEGRELLLFHCVSGYPTPVAESNLRRIAALAKEFQCPIGLSDHTLGWDVAVAAVAIGACAIEKHFTLARADGGPDAEFSLEPDEFRRLVRSVRNAYDALGTGDPARSKTEQANLMFRRSLYVVSDIKADEVFSAENVRSIRPGFGLPPKFLPEIIGRRAACDIRRGTPITWNLVN